MRILFLCTGNSCRSQMAEGWARALRPNRFEALSAGTNPQGLNPLAVRVMAEAGVDISRQRSKSISEFAGDGGSTPDIVITVCDSAHESCPILPNATRVVHHPFDDPPRLAAAATSEAESLFHYRRIRDEIRAFIESLPDSLTTTKGPTMTASTNPPSSTPPSADSLRETVRAGYATIATSGVWSGVDSNTKPKSGCGCSPGGCCGTGSGGTTMTADQVTTAIGYADADLAAIPEGANMGLSCGNPTALAALKPGETVLDLGSGGGLDCFIAGPRVGATGRVIGVDMTAEMIAKARAGAAHYRAASGLDNVEFRLGEIEHLPVADNSVDAVISNCVLNLSPDKPQVWREIARVLKPGGRVAISDLALLRPLPVEVRASMEALVGCIAGATLTGTMEATAHAAGLTNIKLERKSSYTDAMTSAEDPLYKDVIAKLAPGARIGDYITSVDLSATKPVVAKKCC